MKIKQRSFLRPSGRDVDRLAATDEYKIPTAIYMSSFVAAVESGEHDLNKKNQWNSRHSVLSVLLTNTGKCGIKK